MAMEIHVQLFSILRECLPPGSKDGKATLSWADETDIPLEKVITKLGIEKRFEVKAEEFIEKTSWQVLVNGVFVPDMNIRLKPGDQVQIFPPMSGG
jgi:molybdopterin converting factor small subunit